MSAVKSLRSTEISTRTATLMLVAFVALLAVAGMLVFKRASKPAPQRAPHPTAISLASAIATSGKAQTTGSTTVMDKKGKDQAAKDPYSAIVQRNLFRPPTKEEPAAPPIIQGSPFAPTPLPYTPATNIEPLPVTDTTQRVVFTGVAGTPDRKLALLEELSTGKTEFVAVGEEAFGHRILKIESEYVVVSRYGREITMAMGENKPDTPSRASTASRTPGTATPNTPGMPNMPATATGEGNTNATASQPGQIPAWMGRGRGMRTRVEPSQE